MSTYTYLSNDNDNRARRMRLFGRERPIYEILGGGKAANILLWRDKAVSGAVFIGVLTLWFLFEVAEYNLVTFLCHFTITLMLVIFIWSNGAKVFKWTPPEIPKFLLEESMLCKVICEKLNVFLSWLIYIACGNDIKLFCLVILVVSMLSTIGNYITASNLLFIGKQTLFITCFLYLSISYYVWKLFYNYYTPSNKYKMSFYATFVICQCIEGREPFLMVLYKGCWIVCMGTLPYLYERHEEKVNYLFATLIWRISKAYNTFDRNIVSKIPRWPLKHRKYL
uniref:Reticulon-like protein n=1 Tax=Lactuca sativa TaxID=4236 RepID=A0A9R1UM65_LACSA|nr:hypothetical protein LSAT_V11C800446170 [Lactuca sativa]